MKRKPIGFFVSSLKEMGNFPLNVLDNWRCEEATYSSQEHHPFLLDPPPLSMATEFLARLVNAVTVNGA